MRSLNEFVARQANREDKCTGRFCEGRFKCQALLDEAACLACMTYVDLNPIRAKIAETPEESEYTSVYERIEARRNAGPNDIVTTWLCPIGKDDEPNREGLLPINLDEYLDLLDWTGREICADRKGRIPSHLAPILTRLEIDGDRWVDTVTGYGGLFYRVAGRLNSMVQAAKKAGLKWLCGMKASREAFLTE